MLPILRYSSSTAVRICHDGDVLSLSSFVQCAVSRFLHRLPPIARPMPTAEGGWGEEVGGKEEKLPVSPPLLARKRKEVAEGREKKTKEREREVSPPLFFR